MLARSPRSPVWLFAGLTGLLLLPGISQAGPVETLLSWWLQPMSGASEHHVTSAVAWHARLMVLAWGILLPLGALTARFFKVLPGQDWPRRLDHKAWWHAHRTLQYTGIGLMTAGVALAWNVASGQGVVARAHAALGWTLCLMGWAQVVSGLLRGSKGGPTGENMRGDHYDMSPWRIGFERIHKFLGWFALTLALVTLFAGLVVADAPRWMAGVLGLWWLGFGVTFARLQKKGRCMDTYQAIWGPDEVHPGNQRPLTGWGVRRYTAASWQERFGSNQSS